MIRTDLAMEATEAAGGGAIPGVEVANEDKGEGIHITTVRITSPEGEKRLGKGMGTYVTVEVPALANSDRSAEEAACTAIAAQIRQMAGDQAVRSGVLVVGLGNRMVTADSLGPAVCDSMFITRHIRQYVTHEIDERINNVCAVAPGVLGVTGMETGEIIEGVVDNIKPALIIAIDSLASRNVSRIRTTVQLTDSGISPGSGLGNKRRALNRETMGVPVIAIGIPLVVYASTVAEDLVTSAYRKIGVEKDTEAPEFRKMIDSLSTVQGAEMIVTPKEIDYIIQSCARVLSNSLNLALHENLQLAEIQKYMN